MMMALRMSEYPLVEFPTTEEKYGDWIRSHPHGFVVDSWKKAAGVPDGMNGMTWHRADCDTIQPDMGIRHVTGKVMKACPTNTGALA
jgi:hypothetical protein